MATKGFCQLVLAPAGRNPWAAACRKVNPCRFHCLEPVQTVCARASADGMCSDERPIISSHHRRLAVYAQLDRPAKLRAAAFHAGQISYIELREQDALKFGESSREYVLLHDKSED